MRAALFRNFEKKVKQKQYKNVSKITKQSEPIALIINSKHATMACEVMHAIYLKKTRSN
jgi:hypothetical protein